MLQRVVPRVSSRVCASVIAPSQCRFYSLRSSSSSLSSALLSRRGLEWRHLVGAHTAPETIEAFKEIDAKLTKMQTEVGNVPREPAPIDWKQWYENVQNKDAVLEFFLLYHIKRHQIREEEQLEASAGNADLEVFNHDMDGVIGTATKLAAVTDGEAAKLRDHIKALEVDHVEQGDGIQTMADFYLENPGIERQLLNEFENAEFVPTPAEKRLGAIEIGTIRTVLEKGGHLNVGEIPGDRFGDFKPTEEYKKLQQWEVDMFGKLPGFKPILTQPLAVETDPYADDHEEEHH